MCCVVPVIEDVLLPCCSYSGSLSMYSIKSLYRPQRLAKQQRPCAHYITGFEVVKQSLTPPLLAVIKSLYGVRWDVEWTLRPTLFTISRGWGSQCPLMILPFSQDSHR